MTQARSEITLKFNELPSASPAANKKDRFNRAVTDSNERSWGVRSIL